MHAGFRIELLGSFRLIAPDGSRIFVRAKRSRILLAMLSTSRSGERSRRWLQERLWGSRERNNAQASLRRELANFRALLQPYEDKLLIIERDSIGLNLEIVSIDIRNLDHVLDSREEFLEGIDIAWEEGFEDWLRDERQALSTMRENRSAIPRQV